MPATADGNWTVEMALALPADGNRYEVVDGELLVSPAPSLAHQAVASELFRRLDNYARAEKAGKVFWSPADIELDARTLVQPDLFVIPAGIRPRAWKDVKELELAVEILSPTTARYDRHVKRRRYQRHGVTEYWIVDCDARLIERWHPEDERPEILAEAIVWQPTGAATPLTIDLVEFFGEALD